MSFTTEEAVNKLTTALKDPDFFVVWHSEIRQSMYDEYVAAVTSGMPNTNIGSAEIQSIFDKGATRFLKALGEFRPTIPETGSELIDQERWEQINKHGFDVGDDDYKNEELINAAMYCLNPTWRDMWPWADWETEAGVNFRKKIEDGDRISQLKKAGAFIAAEIDRLQRKDATQPKKEA